MRFWKLLLACLGLPGWQDLPAQEPRGDITFVYRGREVHFPHNPRQFRG